MLRIRVMLFLASAVLAAIPLALLPAPLNVVAGVCVFVFGIAQAYE